MTKNLNLLEDRQEGALSGEGANFFVLSGEKANSSYASIGGIETFYKPENYKAIEEKIKSFLKNQGLGVKDIDLLILGFNGNPKLDGVYTLVEDNLFTQNPTAYFKHLSGEYDTAVSFGVWLASKVLKKGTVPPIIQRRKYTAKATENVLIYNHVRHVYHSLILLKKV